MVNAYILQYFISVFFIYLESFSIQMTKSNYLSRLLFINATIATVGLTIATQAKTTQYYFYSLYSVRNIYLFYL